MRQIEFALPDIFLENPLFGLSIEESNFYDFVIISFFNKLADNRQDRVTLWQSNKT